uniref:Bromodomain adjacent to zinc finger domain, 2A n=1 Tax=Salmo trutta TaxID=8032 RepID=A0A674ES46_SALTR
MEANNHFNYGTHSSVSVNSGLKLSSGDSVYTNGSSMSFPQQEKNINGEMNVNGSTTVIGSSVPGSHPPTAPYPHMSNHHHQSSMGYDYLWGGQPQYSPAMSLSPGHGMHQKQPPTGVMQQQSQQHFQGHGQYQLNGGMPGSRQPPVAPPPNMTLTGGQYWNRVNPGQQQSSAAMAMGYNSHSVYGAYQSQVHPGIAPSQHHQQQPPQPPPHQQTQQQQHHHHQQQQPQHYSMVSNGIPYYQPQHPPLPAPQPQAQMMPPTSQNFTPPRGSPQHHQMGQGGPGSPLPMAVSSVPIMSPSTMADSGSPQRRMSEAFKDVDEGYNGMERASVAQRLPKSDSYPPKPPGPPMGSTSDDCQRSKQPMAQHHEMTTLAREPALPELSSPPLMLQGLRPFPVSVSTLPSVVSPPSVSAPPPKPPALPPLLDKSSRPPSVSAPHPVSAPPPVSVAHQTAHTTSAPPAMVSTSTMVSAPPHSMSVPISALQQMFWTSSSMSASASRSISVSSLSQSVSTRLPAVSASPTVSVSVVSSFLKEVSMPPLTVHGPRALPLSGPPPLTSQTSRAPPLSVPLAVMTAPLVVPSAPPLSAPPPQAPKRMVPPEPEERCMGNMKYMGNMKGPSVEADTVKTSSKIDSAGSPTRQCEKHSNKPLTVIPGMTPHPKNQEDSSGDQVCAEKNDTTPMRGADIPLEKGSLDDICVTDESTVDESFDESLQAESIRLDSTRMEDPSLTEEDDISNNSSFDDTSRLDDISSMNDTSRLDDISRVDGDNSRFDDTSRTDDDTSRFDDSSRIDGNKSQIDYSARMDDSACMDDSARMEETSHVGDTTMDSSFSSVEDSRELTLDDTQTENVSRAEETMDSCLSTEESMQESSLNNTSQMQDSSVDLSQNDISRSSSNGPAKPIWRREIRVKKNEDRLKGETWYYSPCGRRMKQFPEVIKYLNRHQDTAVTREHFSFSPRMPVGDFYEERDSTEGVKWCLLANEEVPSMIMAITGRRGRPPNPDKEMPRPRARRTKGGPVRKPGRPPKPKMVDLLSKVDARMLKRLEAKDGLTEEDKEKLVKIKKKMKRKARMKRKEDNKNKKIRLEKKQTKEVKAEPADQEASQPAPPQPPTPEPKKRGPRKKVEVPPPVVETDQERLAKGKRVLGARSKAKALAKAQAEAEAAAQAALAAKKQVERRAQAQRRLEERRRQQMILEELKKPTEDMCLTDHQPLPELSRIPGLVLSGVAFSHCLAVVEFLYSYGKVLGLHIPSDVPSLSTLQEGLLGLGDSQSEVQDLLIKLVEAALHDPGLPPYYQSVKILGEKLVDLELTRSTVSEGLRIFLESHGFDMEVCNVLRTKTFLTLNPDTKAAILGFLVEELNGSNIVISEIDNTLENRATYRKNKWIIEGKLRKLKAALARRTGRSEEELYLEERRRSARVAEEENLSLEESSGPMERGSRRRTPKEEPKLSETDSPTNASIPELERQIDKLTKRQVFFRKKLLQSSHSLRAVSLGQDRFRRRYWLLPHLGGVLVEGPEEILEDILVKEVTVTLLKREPKVEEMPTTTPAPPVSSPPPQSQNSLPPKEDPLPGTASLMSSPRARGRPRKIKPEVELHLRTAKCRRRRRSSKSGGEESGVSLETTTTNGTEDLTQSAFSNCLSQLQGALTNGTEPATGMAPKGRLPEDSVKEMAEKQGQWFNLLPKQPCDKTSLTEPQAPPSKPPKRLPLTPSTLPALAAPLFYLILNYLSPSLQSVPDPTPQVTPSPAKPGRRRRRGGSPARRVGARGAAAKRRGRPSSTLFQEIEQQYFTQLVVKPIPASMVRGWWWIKEPEDLTATLQALHPRGIREKVLHKHLAKHMEYLAEVCTRPINDPIFQVKVKEGEALLESLQQPWQVQERALETDVGALRWVEDLEQRVIAADLHLKVRRQEDRGALSQFSIYLPEVDSTRDDLQYYEHDVDPRDDWIVRTKKEWSDLPRVASHPLDLAVLRLANLERNIDRRYLKEPLWNLAEVVRLAPLTPEESQMGQMDVMSLESEITPRLRTWRQALDRCRSAPQLCLCLLQLEKAIAWERSVVKVTCQVCRKGDNDEYLLLCDGCDRGCHMYCLRPKVTQVPEGDWFCPTCVSKASDGESPRSNHRSSKQRTRVKKRRYEDDSSDEEVVPSRRGGASMATRHKDGGPASSSRYSGDGGRTAGFSPAKRRRMTTRNQPDLTYCEIILMEMESHADAWPFLEPVNPRVVPGYRRIIKNPMDFLTMRERLLQGGYCSCEEFAADAHLVFNNCELFNEDTSEVGMAGHSMKRFFENRWAEFYASKDQ